MCRKILVYFLWASSCLFMADCQNNKSIIAEGATVEKLADGFSFTEGPAVDKAGNVYFTDQPNDKIFKWSVDDKLTEYATGQGRANGMYFDNEGNLLSCSDLNNELWQINADGSHVVLVSDFDGKKLNGPNDLWVHPKTGGIYFTDPLYPREYWTSRSAEMQQDGQHVYYISPDYMSVTRVATDFKQPNGIIGTPDGKTLYVADIGDRKTYAYDIQNDGTLAGKRLLCEMGSDGMTIDSEGNIYLTGRGVTVFNPAGEQILNIPVEAGWTANACFGGSDMKWLYITASQGFYRIRMNVKGVK